MKYLLVEGNADKRVIESIQKVHDIKIPTLEIIPCGGFNEVCREINPTILNENTAALGIIVDADSNISGRWQRLKQELAKADTDCPDVLPNTGLIIDGDVKIGIWIMPNNDVNGMLEDFIAFLIPDQDTLKEIAQDTLTQIEADGLNQYSLAQRPKALIHTWLAWQEYPGRPLNIAIDNRYLSTDAELCRNFLNWLDRLFTE